MLRTPILLAAILVLVAAVWLAVLLLLEGPPQAGGAAERSEEPRGSSSEVSEASASERPADTAIERERTRQDPERPGGDDLDPSRSTGRLQLRLEREDERPVAGARLFVMPARSERLGRQDRACVTDENGEVLLDALDPGRYFLHCPRGARGRVDVVAGQQVEKTLVLKGALEVRGKVTDPEGRAVAGASVWLASWRRDWMSTTFVVETDAQGRFDAGAVQRERSLGASAPGFAPSELVDLERVDATNGAVELHLVLTVGGAGLEGRVLDPGGAPVSGAMVAVGRSPSDYSMRHDGTTEENWGARVIITDADGAFSFDGLPHGHQALHALAEGFPEFAETVELPPGERVARDIQLAAGLSVVGVVRDLQGEPVAEALLLQLPEPFEDPFPTQGPTDKGSPFHIAATRSGDDGRYVLGPLAPGALHLHASKGTSYWDHGVDFLGTVQVSLQGGAGDTLEWDPVLSAGSSIRGRVVYSDGDPMPQVFVSATDADGRRLTESADSEGRFRIPGLEPRAYLVAVQLWDAPDDAIPLEQHDVWPSDAEVLLRASYSAKELEQGLVLARIDDRADRVVGRGSIVFAHDRGWYHATSKDGVFRSRLPPGRYQARVMSGDEVVGASEWFDLAEGEERDLGEVSTRPAAGVRVVVHRPPALADTTVHVSCETSESGRRGARALPPDQPELVFDGLLAGEAVLTLGGSGVAVDRRSVSLHAGEPSTVEFELVPAARLRLHVDAAERQGFGILTIALRHESSGALYCELPYRERWGARLPLESGTDIPPGPFLVEATTSSGLQAEARIEMTAALDPVELRLTLR